MKLTPNCSTSYALFSAGSATNEDESEGSADRDGHEIERTFRLEVLPCPKLQASQPFVLWDLVLADQSRAPRGEAGGQTCVKTSSM
jgi:hypothetical protein